MGDKYDRVSSVSDSGVPESVPSSSTVQAESPGSSPSASPSIGSLGQFTAIDKGVLGYSDSSQTSSATEKVSTEVEDDKWNPAAPTSTSQTPRDMNLPAESAMAHPNQESGSRLEGKASQNQTWKDQVPTLDSYSPTPAPPVSMEAPSSPAQNGDQASFTVGPPNAVPLEEENVESSSDMVVQKPEMLLTGDAKEDKRKIQNLEAKLRDTEAKVEQLKKELAAIVKEKEEGQKKLEQAEEEIKRMETENAQASAAMQQKHEEEIKALKKILASTEKEKSDQQAKYCKKIEDLNAQLKQLEKKHNNEKFLLIKDKHELELKVERMNTNEERLKRELAEANTKVAKLQCELKCQKHAKEVEVLRTQSANALAEKDSQHASALAEKDSQIEELKRQLSFQTPGSPQGSNAE